MKENVHCLLPPMTGGETDVPDIGCPRDFGMGGHSIQKRRLMPVEKSGWDPKSWIVVQEIQGVECFLDTVLPSETLWSTFVIVCALLNRGSFPIVSLERW